MMIPRPHLVGIAAAMLIMSAIGGCTEKAVPVIRATAAIPDYLVPHERMAAEVSPPQTLKEAHVMRLEEADGALRWLRGTIIADHAAHGRQMRGG